MDGCCFGFGSDGSTTGGGVMDANDGLSLSGTTVQLGQAVGAPGDPAELLEAREIPLNGFGINAIDRSMGCEWLVDFANTLGVSLRYDSNVLGAFASILFFDSNSGAAWNVTNDAGGNIVMQNQADNVLTFTSVGNTVIGTAGNTHSLSVLGANDSGNNPNNVIAANGQLSLVGNSDDTVPAKINFVNNADASNASIAWGNDQLIFDAFQIIFTPDASSNVEVSGDLLATGTIQTGDPGAGAGLWQLGVLVTAASVVDTTKYLQVKQNGTVYKIATFQ